MAVTIDGIRLWQTQEDVSTMKGDVRVDSVYGDQSEDTLLTGLTSKEELEYNGIATGNRLALQSGYSNDPNVALAEWVAKMEALVDGRQGNGYTLKDDERGDEKRVCIESFGWMRQDGAKYEVRWDLTVKWAEGMMPSQDSTPDSVNPNQSWSLDGNTLPPVKSYRQTKKQQLEVAPITFANPGDNIVKANSGAVRRILIQGQVTDNEGLNAFDDRIQALVGQDQVVQFTSGFPGRTKDVMVRNFEGTREAGRTRIGEYTLELIEGRAG